MKDCHDKFDGTGLGVGAAKRLLGSATAAAATAAGAPAPAPSNALADACRPAAATILETCTNLPIGQPRPEGFTSLVQDQLGITMKHGIKCFDGICAFRDKIVAWDTTMLLIGVGLFIATFVCKFMMNGCIKAAKRGDQKAAQEAQKKALGRK